MTYRTFNRYAPGEYIRADELNRLLDEVRRQAKVTAVPPLMVYDGPGGTAIAYRNPEFWAVVCSPSGSGYTIKEVKVEPGGTFSVLSGGRTGTGYEANGNTVPQGVVVKVSPGAAEGEYVFANCCTGVNRTVNCAGSSGSSSSSAAGCTTCVPLLRSAYCSSGTLLNAYQYLTLVNGQFCLRDTPC